MITFRLPDTRTTPGRECVFTPAAWGVVDGYLTIRVGEIGPRGGRGRYKVDGYFVQVFADDPADHRPGRLFMLAKDSDADPAVYEVFVADRGILGYCTCPAFANRRDCKHVEALYHLYYAEGWGHDRPKVVTPELAELPAEPCVDAY